MPATSVTHAVLRVGPVPRDADLLEAVEQLTVRVEQRGRAERVHLALGGVDPSTWQTVEFATVAELDAADTEDTIFTVPHTSQPTAWS